MTSDFDLYFHTTLMYNSCVKVGDTVNYREQLNVIIENNNGILTTSDAFANGISKYHFFEYVKEREMEKAAPGIYLSGDAWEDGMYILQSRYNQAVFSHETALYLLNMADREPLQYAVTVKGKYNAPKLKEQGVKIYRVKPELYDIGMIETRSSYGHIIRTYNAERTVCDIIRSRSNIEMQDFQTGLKEYVKRRDKNLPLLMEYAEKFHIETILRRYLEVLL